MLLSTLLHLALLLGGAGDGPRNAPHFEAQVIDDDLEIGYGLAVGDVDGDGDLDVLLADKKAFVWYRNGDWQRFVMAENLTEHDNVAIAARDVDGDGRVEVAVGAQWNPGETSDPARSGSVHVLLPPDDPTARWEAVTLPHEPTVHRMHWVRAGPDGYRLVVLPLHGRGNVRGEGAGVKVFAYTPPPDPRQPWTTTALDTTMHLTHNFDVLEEEGATRLYVAGLEGVHVLPHRDGRWQAPERPSWPEMTGGAGEVRVGHAGGRPAFLATIEPMHGTTLAVYPFGPDTTRVVLDDDFVQGHALAAADLLGTGSDQVVAGWREPNGADQVGLKLYVPRDGSLQSWDAYLLDDDMATEDVKVADLDGDGRLDIIAAGRATKNLKVYWNR